MSYFIQQLCHDLERIRELLMDASGNERQELLRYQSAMLKQFERLTSPARPPESQGR